MLKDNSLIVLIVVSQNGIALKYASFCLRVEKLIIDIAVKLKLFTSYINQSQLLPKIRDRNLTTDIIVNIIEKKILNKINR